MAMGQNRQNRVLVDGALLPCCSPLKMFVLRGVTRVLGPEGIDSLAEFSKMQQVLSYVALACFFSGFPKEKTYSTAILRFIL